MVTQVSFNFGSPLNSAICAYNACTHISPICILPFLPGLLV